MGETRRERESKKEGGEGVERKKGGGKKRESCNETRLRVCNDR